MHYCKNINCKWFWVILFAVLCCNISIAGGNHAHIRSAELVLREEIWTLDADIDIQIGKGLEEALNKGVVLVFLYEVQIVRPVKYWFDDEIVTERREISLSFHALTKQYLLQFPQQQKSFDTLADARRELGTLNAWRIAPHAAIEKNQVYKAALKMHLDTSKLPKALQVDALGESDWELATPTFNWWLKESVH